MSRLPVLSFRDLNRVLIALGFAAVPQKGSHVFYRHPDGRTTTDPNRPGRGIARPLLGAILHDVGLEPDALGETLGR